jgi:hypothetical protein
MFSWIFKLLAAGIIISSNNILIVVLVSLHSQGIIISSNNILIVVLVSLICNRKKEELLLHLIWLAFTMSETHDVPILTTYLHLHIIASSKSGKSTSIVSFEQSVLALMRMSLSRENAQQYYTHNSKFSGQYQSWAFENTAE